MSLSSDPSAPVIVAAMRTPLGKYLGGLSGLSAIDLGQHAARAVVSKAGVDPTAIDETVVGCVLPAGLGQAPARSLWGPERVTNRRP